MTKKELIKKLKECSTSGMCKVVIVDDCPREAITATKGVLSGMGAAAADAYSVIHAAYDAAADRADRADAAYDAVYTAYAGETANTKINIVELTDRAVDLVTNKK